jgi:hypothetical protein
VVEENLDPDLVFAYTCSHTIMKMETGNRCGCVGLSCEVVRDLSKVKDEVAPQTGKNTDYLASVYIK